MDVKGQFVFSQTLTDCLLRLKYTPEDKEELIHFCEKVYDGNTDQLKCIEEFRKDYSPDKALWWYTRESFFYKTLNAGLRNQDIHLTFLFRVYIFDIYCQLKRYQAVHPLRVYRCQMVSSDELKTLKGCHDQLISVNSFFSTSANKKQALSFLNASNITDKLVAVLFEIDADPAVVTTKPFSDITEHSEFADEAEVLFMSGSIFRLNSVDYRKDDKVWVARMTLSSENYSSLKSVLLNMRKQLGTGDTDLRILGKLLSNIGEFALAEKYLKRFLNQLPRDSNSLVDLYEELATITSQAGQFDKSMEWHQKALELNSQNPSDSSKSTSKYT
jgi:tetratricopeptide (TPR) repeat protein